MDTTRGDPRARAAGAPQDGTTKAPVGAPWGGGPTVSVLPAGDAAGKLFNFAREAHSFTSTPVGPS